MSQQLRFIVDKLNTPPFSNKFNMVTFDALDTPSLHQVLNDVLAEISSEHRIDLRQEQFEQTAVRIFSFLKVLKYNPNQGEGLNAFRQGLIEGDKTATYALLYWLLERMPDHKKRAYLSKYLAKIDIPAEFQQDEQIIEAIETHDSLVQQFKDMHRAVEQQRNSKFNVADVRKDIASMEEEKQQLSKRIERLKQRTMTIPNSAEMLSAAQNLRQEMDRELELRHQLIEQKSLLIRTEQKLESARKEYEEAERNYANINPQKMLAELEEENRLKSILTEDSIPKKVESLNKESMELEQILAEPMLSESEMYKIREEIASVTQEIAQLVEKRMPGKDPEQDRVALFRQQASIITRKREKAAEEYKTVMDELTTIKQEIESNKEKLNEFDGGVALRDEEFKRYVAKLRTISVEYRAKKATLSALKAESGVLDRTLEILKSRDENAQEVIELLEKRKGVHGYRATQNSIENTSEEKSGLDVVTGKKLTDMTAILRELNEKIESKKSLLAPLIKEVRPLRLKHQELLAEHTEKKSLYDGVAVGLQVQRSGLDQEVLSLWSEVMSMETNYHYLQCKLKSLQLQEEKVAAELRSYVGSGSAETKKSLRNEYTVKIQEAEAVGRALRDKQKELKETHVTSLEQVKMWRELKKLMEIKKECFLREQEELSRAKAVERKMIAEENRLVIS